MQFLVGANPDAEPQSISGLLNVEDSSLVALPDIGAVQRIVVSPGETGEITRLDHHVTLHRAGAPLLHSWHERKALAPTTMRKGLVHVRPAHAAHRSAWDARCALTIIALSTGFVAQCAADLFKRDLAQASVALNIGGLDPFLWQLGERLDELAQRPDPPWVFMDEVASTMAMHLLLKAGERPDAHAARALTQHTVRKISEHVDAHLACELRLSDLAALCDMSPFHFSRQFKRETGFSPGRFIRMRRMKEASRLLVGTGLGIEDITAAVGYQDPSAFRRAFIQEHGMTPSRFRRGRFS